MSVAVKIVSVILKSIVSNRVENELAKNLIEIPMDSISETYIPEIVKFIYEGKSQIEKVLSKENLLSLNISDNKCDFVVAEIKDLVSKIELTDEIYREYKYNDEQLKNFLWSKYSELKENNIEYENEIKKVLFLIAKELLTLKKGSEEFETDLLIQISNTVDDTKIEVQKLFEDTNNNSDKLDKNAQILIQIQQILLLLLEKIQTNNKDNDIINNKEFQNNKKGDYIKNWNSRLFLHIDNDENPLTLADTFITPDYKIHKQIKRIRFSKEDALDNVIDKFIKYDRTSTMLITGVPGIGKSSITSWIANRYKDDDRVLILRFRDWKYIILEKNLLELICKKFECEEENLDNKILVLDGFDEMKSLIIQKDMLDTLFDSIKDFDNFKCIITSRPAYIDSTRFENVVELQQFNIDKVDRFYTKITGNKLKKGEKIESNLEVLGIPVILYMAIMSEIDISKNPTKPELYNRIFAERGGIFDKFQKDGYEYDNASQILRNPKNAKKYLKFLGDIAFEMFEVNTLVLQKEQSSIPELEISEEKISVLEFPIKHLFESTEFNLEFIHKTIYEYFVSEHIFHSICEGIKLSKDRLAGVLGDLLKKDILSPEILEFLKYKIINSRLKDKFDIINESFNLMLEDGMTYHTGICYKNSMNYEINIFANMLEIIHMWSKDILEFDNAIVNYIRCNSKLKLNLKNLNLEDADLKRVNLTQANLIGANLREADLKYADLTEADLRYADLTEADLTGADLAQINLIGVNLTKAHLTDVDLTGINLTNANLTDVDLSGSDLRTVNLTGGNLTNANLANVDLSRANLTNANLSAANLSGANLTGVDLRGADLTHTNLRGVDLKKINLTNKNLSITDLTDRKLSEIKLGEADLIDENLMDTYFSDLDLTYQNLIGINFSNPDLTDAILNENQVKYLDGKCNLREVKIYLDQTKETISYEEYCNRRNTL